MGKGGVGGGGRCLDGMACVDYENYRGDQTFLTGKGDVSKLGISAENKEEKVLLVKKNSLSFSDESSSSIGENTDLSENSMEESGGDGEEEVQSSYKGGALDAMEALEEVLPIRRGISRFYNGKSKSFASLGDASTAIKDIAKPDNPYSRRRRNLLACTRMRTNGRGVSKRVTSSSRAATLALAVALATSDSKNQAAHGDSNSPPSVLQLSSPLGKDFSAWRSFSLADLHHCVSDAKSNFVNSDPLGTKPQ